MYNPRDFKRQFTAPHIICSAHKLNTSVEQNFLVLALIIFTKTADCSQLIVEFNSFFHDFYMIKRGYILSSNERFIFFNSHLVNAPDFRAHYLNICTLLLRHHCLR